MGLENIMAAYHLSGDAEERFQKEFIRNLHGTVSINLGALLPTVLLLCLLGMAVVSFVLTYGGIIGMLLLIVYAVATVLILWELMSFRIDFDGATGFVQYHTLLHGTTVFHIEELMLFDLRQQRFTAPKNPVPFVRGKFHLREFSQFFHARRTLRVRELLYITTAEGIICVPLASSWFTSKLVRGAGGYRGAEKLYSYLDLYRRYVLKYDSAPAQSDAEQALSPAVRAAILAAHQEPAPDPDKGIPELTENDFNPAAFASVRPGDAALSTPDISVPVSGEPETHILPQKFDTEQNPVTPQTAADASLSAEASPAPKPEPSAAFPIRTGKPASDVDELFNNVLRQYGKRK